jgi:ketosteroid isomerase-like protein
MKISSHKRIPQLVSLIVFIGGLCLSARAALSPEDHAAIQNAHDAAAKPLEKNPAKVDWPAYIDAQYDAKAKIMPADNPILQGRDAIIAFFNGLPPLSVFKTEAVEIDGEGNIAYLRGTYKISLNPPDGTPINDQGKYLQVWRKRANGSWRCILDIYNSDLPPG